MNAFGSPRAGCAFRLFGLALILSGSGCAVIVLQAPVDLQSLVYLAVAAVLLGGGFLFIWDTQRTQDAANERRSGFTKTTQKTATQLEKRGYKLISKMPNFDGDFESLSGTGWTHVPQNYSVTCERGLKQYWGGVQMFITVAFDPRTGEQWGPVYHLAPAISSPCEYGINLTDWADPNGFDYKDSE